MLIKTVLNQLEDLAINLFRNSSIFLKINILFLLSVLITIIASALYQKNINAKVDMKLIKDSRNYIYTKHDLISEPLKSDILKNSYFIKQSMKTMMDKDCRMEMNKAQVLIFKSKVFYFLSNSDLMDSGKIYKLDLIPTYLGIIILLFFSISYILILQSLKPLKTLENSIRRFGDGDYNIEFEINSQDEVGKISKEFSKVVKKISALERSRELFLRNIIHELKTPITKGKLSIALLEKRRETEILEKVFIRLDLLINEMAHIEKITSNSENLNIQKYSIKDIINEAISIGFFNKHLIEIQGNKFIYADKSLISIAFKNLIDNGLKYSENGKILILTDNQSIKFISTGIKLQKDFTEYIKPFNHSQITSKSGFGLGLYIIYEIAKKHSMTFTYKYIKNQNTFILS